MSVVTTQVSIPHGRPFTVADLELMPDDGNRYELIDGVLMVSPAPIRVHQEMSAAAFIELVFALRDGRYEQVGHAVGDEPFHAEEPVPVTIVPARLLDGTRP